MREADRLRRERIAQAAVTILRERGYRRASLLEIAKAAGASNQTMYRWYGSKQGLFRSLIEGNAARAKERLDAALDGEHDPIAALDDLALLVLRTVTGASAIDLNRAAAADASETNELGAALAAAGRGQIVPRVIELVERAHRSGALAAPDAAEAAERWVALIVGDLQIRIVTGAMAAPSDAELAARAASGSRAFLALHRPALGPAGGGVA